MSHTTVIEGFRDLRAATSRTPGQCCRSEMLAAVSLICTALACAASPEPAPKQAGWSNTGAMTAARAEHTAALLPSGQVLVAGGLDHLGGGDAGEWTCLSTSDLYDPAMGTWADAGSMLGPRCTWDLLPISKGPYAGKVMVGGGISAYVESYWLNGAWWWAHRILSTTELFDPTTGTWSPGPPLLKHSIAFIQLADGKLLAVGSFVAGTDSPPTSEVQLLDVSAPEPAWRFVQPMNDARVGPALVLLDDGEVLAVGGWATHTADSLSPAAERYDPVNDRWTRAAPPPTKRWHPVVIKLPSGDVLFTAGCYASDSCDDPAFLRPEPSAEAWIYEPARDVWRPTSPMNYPRAYANGTLLDSGKVLVASGNWKRISDGGHVDYYPAPAPEIFDPITETWSTTDPMPHYVERAGAMVTLQSGAVLFTGGYVNYIGDTGPVIPGADLATSEAQIFREGQ